MFVVGVVLGFHDFDDRIFEYVPVIALESDGRQGLVAPAQLVEDIVEISVVEVVFDDVHGVVEHLHEPQRLSTELFRFFIVLLLLLAFGDKGEQP